MMSAFLLRAVGNAGFPWRVAAVSGMGGLVGSLLRPDVLHQIAERQVDVGDMIAPLWSTYLGKL
jgi:hypothetical protein